jgi:superfamily II DNA or RNA helicase
MEVISIHEKFSAWVLHMSHEESNIISTINDGLRHGHISIPEASHDNRFPAVNTVVQYLNAFGVMIAERIKGQFNPLFDPATESLSPEILAVNDHIKLYAGYSLFDAQLAVAEAHKRRLEIAKSTLCIAECGTGKCKIGASALHAYQQRLNYRKGGSAKSSDLPSFVPSTLNFTLFDSGHTAHTKKFNIVLSPSHMAKKWIREIEESLPNTFAVIVKDISELNKVYEAYERGDQTCYVIITKEKARDGYMRRPAVVWNKHRKEFTCPDCFETLEMDVIDCGTKYRIPADALYFLKETTKNRKCDECGSVLWGMLVPEQQSDWVKVSDYGFIYRHMAYAYLKKVEKKPKIYDAILTIAENPERHFPNNGAYSRFPLSTYVKYHMKGKLDGLIVDELHDFNNDSGQGDAMGELFQAAKKVIGMTATLINGYSSGIFHLLYRIAPDLMLRDNKKYERPSDFNSEYGVSESVYEIDAPDYNANRRSSRRKLREKQLPGVSPMVYSRFLMESAVFLMLRDMGKDLPEYEEIPIQLQMNNDVDAEYRRIEGQFIQILKNDRKIGQKILSAYLNLLTVYPDQPYGHEPVKHPLSGDNLVVPADVSSFEELHQKDYEVLNIVRQKTAEGGRVLIYTSWTRIDTQAKLTKLLSEEGYRVAVLTTVVSPKKREEWVEKQVRSGVQVLITNPSLVETGLDLNDFTTIVFYNISYKLFTLRQSSRRSWRINQRAPRVEVYFFYYEGTMQHRAIRLMASKLAVAGVIEGNLTDEGLAAMSDCQDMTTALARELTNGIEGEIEDLSAVFKKMAILKPVVEASEIEEAVDVVASGVADASRDSYPVAYDIEDNIFADADYDDDVNIFSPTTRIVPKPAIITTPISTSTQPSQVTRANERPEQSSGLLSLLNPSKPKKKKKPTVVMDNQMSLFDMLDATA